MSAPTFTRTNTPFAMTCRVAVNIEANAGIVWSLLTDARGFSRWNSTITGIEGQIREGERLRLHVPGTDRIFTPRVSALVPGRHMVWSNGLAPIFKGVRSFDVGPRTDASTDFAMEERFTGVVFALTRGVLPDFRPIFETYADDLKREAQRIAHERDLAPGRRAESTAG